MAVSSLMAKLAKAALKNSKDLANVIEAASLVVTAASALMETGKPLLDEIDKEAVAEKAKVVAYNAGKGVRTIADGAGKRAQAVKKGADGAASTVAGAFSKLGDTRDAILKDLADSKSDKELKKAIQEARQAVLENATGTMSVKDFVASREATGNAGKTVGGIPLGGFDMPGCFVIATYKKLDFGKDLSDYIGIYVGKANNVSEGIATAISRKGNPDVYADVKFKQNTHVFAFNCLPEDVDERYLGLYQVFDAGKSYNADEDAAAKEASAATVIAVTEALDALA